LRRTGLSGEGAEGFVIFGLGKAGYAGKTEAQKNRQGNRTSAHGRPV
jgi:hypothetical protein